MMHERPAGKIGVYIRFFEYANFRLPLSTFLVDVLMYFRINISQLSVIAAAKVSHFEILCRVYSIEPTVGLFRYFYVNSKNKGWMSFSKRSDNSSISKYPLPKSTEFNVDDYTALVAHMALFRKFPEPFLCLVGMSHYYTMDEDTYPGFLHDDGEGGCLSLYIVHPVVLDLVFDCLFVYAEMDLSAFTLMQKRSKRPINRRLDAPRPPTLPIYVTGSSK
ncbi:hypothetical protein Tco_1321478 [Tanacetum coccineum]